MSIYDFKVKEMDGKEVSLGDFKGKILIIVNTASKCGFTPQYEELQELYDQYKEQDLEILAFPSNQFAEQEPGDNDEVRSFCQLNYGVNFPLFAKGDVRGENALPLFNHLTEQKPFQGFDSNHQFGGILQESLEKNFPSYLEGNSVKWNFTKFLVDRNGQVVGRYEPTTSPLDMRVDIEKIM
ncbi:glutathione peroxidase [Sporomusa sphaeroides DSM 2875]|uniref:glutathione peroxidase n=1 Tax=Sporomusa sphaeroides TaxID=47679 RepID=UPI00202ED111|nr:glutathione peroxidase [Sporomusa sphaeroides]MCM0757760.1 glutathione peroxidase [Sporomusa sphaeroides DSM 2875]